MLFRSWISGSRSRRKDDDVDLQFNPIIPSQLKQAKLVSVVVKTLGKMNREGEAVKFRRVTSGAHDDLYGLEQGLHPTSHHHNHILPSSEKKQLLPKGSVALPILILVWYCTAAIAITTSKKVMTMLPLPFMLCTSQFVVASIVVGLYARLFRKYTPMQANSRAILFKISYSYTFGFVFTNTAFSLVSASFAETVKAAEPISSVFMGLFLLNEGTTLPTYLTLLPICAGVGISCVQDASFHFLGFFCAALSNVCFSGRAVLTKYMFKSNQYGFMDEVSLFAHISNIGLTALIPLVLLLEGRQLLTIFQDPTFDMGTLFLLLFLNGIMYSVYNLASFLVLGQVELVAHAVLNAFRRVFIILFTSYYFGVHLSGLNIGGVMLAVFGVLLFGYSRAREVRPAS